jgi:predicted ATP-dependent protease
VLAAHRKGLKRVILPRRNERDLADLPAQAREELEFVLVDEMSEVIEHALLAPIRSDGPVRAVDTTEDATLVEPIGGWTGLEPSPGGTAHGGDA